MVIAATTLAMVSKGFHDVVIDYLTKIPLLNGHRFLTIQFINNDDFVDAKIPAKYIKTPITSELSYIVRYSS